MDGWMRDEGAAEQQLPCRSSDDRAYELKHARAVCAYRRLGCLPVDFIETYLGIGAYAPVSVISVGAY